MDTILTILLYLLLGLAAFLVIGFIGLKFPAPLAWPFGEPTENLEQSALPDGLPQTVRQWFSGDSQTSPRPVSLVAWGRGWIASRLPIVGKVWLPLSWTLYLQPGSSFIMQTRITWFRQRFIRGGEEYRDGKGVYILGAEALQKPFMDETERALAWLYFLWLCPGSLIHLPQVHFQELPDTTRLIVEDAGLNPLTFQLAFDPQTHSLQTIQTTRKGSTSGIDYPYQATFSQPEAFEEMGLLPTRFTGEWDGDLILQLELIGLQPNQDITEAMQTGVVDLK